MLRAAYLYDIGNLSESNEIAKKIIFEDCENVKIIFNQNIFRMKIIVK